MLPAMILAWVVSLPLAQSDLGEQGQPPVSAPAPRMSAGHVAGGDLYLVDVVTSTVPVQVIVRVKDGDTVHESLVTEYRPVYQMKTSRYSLREVKGYDSNGKPLDPAELAQRLKKRSPVLVSADGRKVDPFYLQAIKGGTLILILPQSMPDR